MFRIIPNRAKPIPQKITVRQFKNLADIFWQITLFVKTVTFNSISAITTNIIVIKIYGLYLKESAKSTLVNAITHLVPPQAGQRKPEEFLIKQTGKPIYIKRESM